jgi:hypothetical protein
MGQRTYRGFAVVVDGFAVVVDLHLHQAVELLLNCLVRMARFDLLRMTVY